MIQPDDIKKKASRWYLSILSSSVQGTPDFPRDVPFGKIESKGILNNFIELKEEIEKLKNESKEKKGYGYSVELTRKNTRSAGKQDLPTRIYFEDIDNYLKFLRKEKEYNHFVMVTRQTEKELPQLIPWIESNSKKVLDNLDRWDDILKVCKYFLENPKPNIFIREIPLNISTKFIEENKAIIKYLLDILIEEYVNKNETNFNKRFNLKYDEPLIRLRILDSKMSQKFFSGVDDLSLPQSQFNQLDIPCKRIFVLENKTNVLNFLTLPSMENSIAIFGKGFGVGALKEAEWLSSKQIIYWGDIDTHGFQILSQIRGYFPHTQSCMMDLETFREFEELVVTGTYSDVTELEYLTHEEQLLFKHLSSLEKNNRLEQEKITQGYALKKIYETVNV